MNDWRYVKNITIKNIKMIISSTRLYIVFLIIFCALYIFTDELTNYLITDNVRIGVLELLPVFLNSRLTQLVIFLGWILLVSEIPFFTTNQTNILIRTNRRAVMMGCVTYIICLALFYILFLQLSTMVIVRFRNDIVLMEWSESFTNAARYGANMIGVRTNLVFDFGMVQKSIPIEIWSLQVGIEILLFIIVGLILLCGILLREYYFIGYLFVIGLWAWDFIIVEFMKIEKLLWVSPVSMAKLSNLSFGNVERGPSIIYTIVFDVVFIGMLLIIGSKQIAVYDFSRE